MSSISINKGIASAVLALGVAFSGSVIAKEDAESTPMDAKGVPTETEATVYQKEDINTAVAVTVGKFQNDQPGGTKILEEAKGVLVCPTITKGGFLIGISGGTCALQIGGATVDYYGYSAIKAGALAGVKSYSMIMVFNTEAALGKFRSSKRDWEVGAVVTVAVGEKGASSKLTTTNMRSAIVAFIFGETGVMADASVKGGRFKRIDAK